MYAFEGGLIPLTVKQMKDHRESVSGIRLSRREAEGLLGREKRVLKVAAASILAFNKSFQKTQLHLLNNNEFMLCIYFDNYSFATRCRVI